MRRRQVVLGTLIVVLLLAAAFAVGLRFGDRDGGGAESTVPGSTTVAPAGDSESTSPSGGIAGAAPGTATFSASARSLLIDPGSLPLRSLSLRPSGDQPTLRFRGRVQDGSGRDLGNGAVSVSGLATVSGELSLNSTIVVTPQKVVLGREGGAEPEVQAPGVTTVDGASIMFSRHRDDGPPEEATPVQGPLRLVDGALITIEEGTEWTTPPAEVTATSQRRATASWAGTGEVKLRDGRTFTSQYGGVKGTTMRVTFRREGGVVVTSGELQPQQVYADGLPQLTASANVAIKVPPRPVRSGGRGEFTWAPYNGGAIDMVMTRIRPGNELARSINLALEKLPSMCGAERCPFGDQGGHTDGLADRGGLFGGGASPINAVILPGTGDERRISFDLPDVLPAGSHEMVVIVEGNFEPVTVRIPLTITG